MNNNRGYTKTISPGPTKPRKKPTINGKTNDKIGHIKNVPPISKQTRPKTTNNNTDKPVVPEWFAEWYEREFDGFPKKHKAVEASRMLLRFHLGLYELYPMLLAVVNDEYKIESRYKVQLYSDKIFETYWFANNGEELAIYSLDWLHKEKEIYYNDSRLLSKTQMETLKQKWPNKIKATEVKDWGFTER